MSGEGVAERNRLLAGGFQPSEVADWETKQRAKLLAGGFQPAEVDDYFGTTPTDFTKVDNQTQGFLEGAPQATNPYESLIAGWQNGNVAMTFGKPQMVMPEDANFWAKLTYAIGQGAGDLPLSIVGAVAGAAATAETGPGAVIGAGAGSMALPTAYREVLMSYYREGLPVNPQDFLARLGKVTWETGKASIEGAIGGKVGQVAGQMGGKVAGGAGEWAANILGFTTASTAVNGALNGRIPTGEDFLLGAVAALGPAAAVHVVGNLRTPTTKGEQVIDNLRDIYEKTGLMPDEVLKAAAKDPSIMAELVAPRNADGERVIPGLEAYARNYKMTDPQEAPQPVPEAPKAPENAAFETVKPEGLGAHNNSYLKDVSVIRPRGMDALSPDSAHLNGLQFRNKDDGLYVVNTILPKDARGKGLGVGMYEELLAQAKAEGKPVYSDYSISAEADRVYDALRRRGYVVRENAQQTYMDGGRKVSMGGEPVYRIDPPGAMTAETVPPIHLELFRTLEGSADDAVSPAGAIGRYQIMPETAKQYGFDPAHLQDPAYNEQVARAIIADLSNKFNGRFDDMAVAYNAGPGRARAWIKGGRKLEDLPLETQKYLRHAEDLGAFDNGYAESAVRSNLEAAGVRTDWVMDPGVGGSGKGGGGGREPPLTGDILPPEPNPRQIEGRVLTADEATDRVLDLIAEPAKKSWRDWISGARAAAHLFDTMLSPAKRIDRANPADPGEMTFDDNFRQTFGSYGRAQAFFNTGIIGLEFDPRSGPTWTQTRKGSRDDAYRLAKSRGGTGKGFLAYRMAARLVELQRRGIKAADDRVLEAANLILRDKKMSDTYEPALASIRAMDRSVLEYMTKAGLYDPKRANAIFGLNLDHIPLQRVMDPTHTYPPLPGRSNRPRDPLKRISGSDKQVVDPETTEVTNKMTMIAMADRNMALLHALDKVQQINADNPSIRKNEKLTNDIVRDLETGKTLEAELLDRDGRPIPAEQTEGLEPLLAMRSARSRLGNDDIIVFRDGKPEVWTATDRDMADLFRMVGAGEGDLGIKIFETMAQWQRTGIATDLGFLFRTLTYGQFTSTIFDKGGPLVPYSDFVRTALDQAFNHGKLWDQWVADGGAGASLADVNRRYITNGAAETFDKASTWGKVANAFAENGYNPISWAKSALGAFAEFSRTMHSAAQVGRYIYKTRQGVPGAKAAMDSRRVYLDSAERMANHTMHRWASFAPFLHTSLLDAHQVAGGLNPTAGRARNVAAVMGKASLLLMFPTIANVLANLAADKANGVDAKDGYFNRPRWMRDLYWSTPAIGGAAIQLKAPPSSITFLFKVLPERFLEYVFTQNPRAFDEMLKTWGALTMPAPIPTAVAPLLENLTNYDTGTGRPVVPASLADNSGWMQYGPTTTETAKMLGKIMQPTLMSEELGTSSPLKIENLVNGWAGPLPFAFLKALEAPMRPSPKPSDYANLPLVGSFFVRNWGAGQTLNDYFTTYEAVTQQRGDFLLANKRNNAGEIEATSKMPAAGAKAAKGYRAITNLMTVIRAIDDAKTTDDLRDLGIPNVTGPRGAVLTGDEKRRYVDALNTQLFLMAKSQLDALQSILAQPQKP